VYNLDCVIGGLKENTCLNIVSAIMRIYKYLFNDEVDDDDNKNNNNNNYYNFYYY